jgi:anti-anti-sigma regulatory factor
MFLIKKVYENDLTALLKIEGEITEFALEDWAEALASLLRQTKKHVILDCCDANFVSLKVAERLIQQMTDKIFLLNCPTAVQNLVHAAGFSKQGLE